MYTRKYSPPFPVLAHLSIRLKQRYIDTIQKCSSPGIQHHWVKGIQVRTIEEPLNYQKVDNGVSPLLINVMTQSCMFIDLNCFLG